MRYPDYTLSVVGSLVDGHDVPYLIALRRAADWSQTHGPDYPAADVADEIARQLRLGHA